VTADGAEAAVATEAEAVPRVRSEPHPSGRLRLSLDASAVPEQPSGAGRYVIDLASALSRRDDVEITVACRRGDGVRWRSVGPFTVVDKAPMHRPVRLAWEQVELPRILSEMPLDVHHSPHYTMPERARIPKVVTIHDMTFFDHPEWHERPKVLYFRRAMRVAAERADALITASNTALVRVQDVLAPQAPLHLVPHGVDHERFHPLVEGDRMGAREDEAVLARLGVHEPYVAFIGTLEPRKDVPTLVRAFDSIARSIPDLTLVLAGAPGWGTDAVDAAIAGAAHESRIHRIGYLDESDKPALLRGAAAVAYPSREEGFGLPVLEALACGAPLVTTSGSAMEEVVDSAALLVRPTDTAALAEAVEAAVRGGGEVDERRRRGFDVAARYTWDASAAGHMAVYRSVM
jgi:glycosyltransferase involved in cell wall biosynthesis